MDKRKFVFALGLISVTGLFCILSGGDKLGLIGLALSVGGAVDFLYIRGSVEGYVASEAYGDAGEELWEFRSFILMAGGPFLALYPIIF